MSQQQQELYNVIADFMGKTLTGIYVAVFKLTKQSVFEIDIDNKQRRTLFLARYLNDCWAALVNNTDRHIYDVMKKILDKCPSESPRCIMHLFMKIGSHCIDNIILENGTFDGDHVATNGAFIEYITALCEHEFTKECAEVVEQLFTRRGIHICQHLPLSRIAEESAVPLWMLKKVNPTAIVREGGATTRVHTQ